MFETGILREARVRAGRRAVLGCAGALALVSWLAPAWAQERRPGAGGGLVRSMGQPPEIEFYGSLSAGADLVGVETLAGYGTAGVFRAFLHPAWSLVGVSAETYTGFRGEKWDGGFRAMLLSPYFHFGGGVDYSFGHERLDGLVSALFPVRRGGIVGGGTQLRLDWLPARGHSFQVGLTFPIGRPFAGKTRPRRDRIEFPRPQSEPIPHYVVDPTLEEALENVRASAHWIRRLITPYLDDDARTHDKAMKKVRGRIALWKAHLASVSPLFPEGRSSEAEVRVYHAELDRAFSIAASERALGPGETTELGRLVSAKAKEILLEEILLPYNRLLGRMKSGHSALYFGVFARGSFARWLATASGIREGGAVPVQFVFQELIDVLEENRAISEKEWGDSRLAWLPLQYALLPEQHDSQSELDALVERAVEEDFSEGNLVSYLINESFQWEVAQMVRDAEEYHVLWIHDFRGVNGAGEPDRITFSQVVDSYLGTLIRRVREYDETGKLPVFLIIQDQFYYENNKSRPWLDLLEDPLRNEFDLPKEFRAMEDAVRAAQDELRSAVRNSELLQTEAREYGKEWLHNRVKVHVNITNPSDVTFRSRQVVPMLGILDNVIRDHRKISFYDVTEEDPYKGKAVFSGMGIGEHYVGATWEDRGILVQGPAALALKKACRDVLLSQGFEEDDIPYPLRPKAKPADYEERVLARAAEGGKARGMQLHNPTAYHEKPISVFKAIMYTLMPKGSVMITPDFVWHSPYWSSMLVGAALRGCRAFVILPSLPNQPSPGSLPMARSYEMFARLVSVQQLMGEEIESAGGMLKTGFFDPDMDVEDLAARTKRFMERMTEHEFLFELINPHPKTVATIRDVDAILEDCGFDPVHVVEDADVRKPQLHLKAQFFASREAWEALLPHPLMSRVARTYLTERAVQMETNEYVDPRRLQDALNHAVRTEFTGHVESLPAELQRRVVWYNSVGSQNQDHRGMFLDGEVTFVTSGWESVWGLVDFVWILGMCDWVETLDGVERHLGRYGEWTRRLGRIATPLM